MITADRNNGIDGRRLGRAPLALLCLLALGGCSVSRNYEALLALADIAAGTGPSRLKQATPEPHHRQVSFREGGVEYHADLYVSADAAPEAGIVLVPGAVPEGNDDPRLVAFAKTLARLRFAVLAPELAGYQALKIGPRNTGEVAAATRYLAAQEQWAPEGRVGIAAFSYGAGPAIAAALEPGARERVRFILAIGGYYDLVNAIRFFTTGVAVNGMEQPRVEASEYGKLVFIRGTVDLLAEQRDRELLDAMTAARLNDPAADISGLVLKLGPEGRSVIDLLENRDPARTEELIGKLPARVRAMLEQLNLANKPLDALQARLILVHGKDDRLIPYTESLALARAAPAGQAHVFVIERILSHVDLSFSAFFSRRFWREELPDAWRLWRAQAMLLKERELDASDHASGAP